IVPGTLAYVPRPEHDRTVEVAARGHSLRAPGSRKPGFPPALRPSVPNLVLVRFAIYGSARVDATLRRHWRQALSRFCGEELVAYDGLSLRPRRTSLLPRQHLLRPARSQRQENLLEPRQRLGHGRASPHVAVLAGKPSGPRA